MKKLAIGFPLIMAACAPQVQANPDKQEPSVDYPTPGQVENTCIYGDFILVNDGQVDDFKAATRIYKKVNEICQRGDILPVIMEENEVVNPATDEILVNHKVIISAGGPYVNSVTQHAEQTAVFHFNSEDGVTGTFYKDTVPVKNINVEEAGPAQDTLLIQATYDPQANLFITLYGISGEGTLAAADYLEGNEVKQHALLDWDGTNYTVVSKE